MENRGSEQAPKFSPFDLPRKAGEIQGFLWDTVLSHAKPSAWHRGLAQGSWLGGKLIPLMEDQGRSSCVAEVLPFVPAAEPSKSQTRKPKCGKGTHCSRNAYMLVYRLQAREKSLTVEVPGESLGDPSPPAMLQVGQELEFCLKPGFGVRKLLEPLCSGARLGELEKAPGRS